MAVNVLSKLKEFAKEASRRCGASHDVYVELFSQRVEEAFGPLEKDTELYLMAKRFDYCTQEELASKEMGEGYCRHGLSFDCCPLGCGEL